MIAFGGQTKRDLRPGKVVPASSLLNMKARL
jgi:hypothetical protein